MANDGGGIDISSLGKSVVLGLVASLVACTSLEVGHAMSVGIYEDSPGWAFILLMASTFVLVNYLQAREFSKSVVRILKSRRLELPIALIVGGVIGTTIADQTDWRQFWIGHGSMVGSAFLLITLPGLALSFKSRAVPAKDGVSSFLSDMEIFDEESDHLKNNNRAIDFAKIISMESRFAPLVFGIDGPWGVGKSSFINLANNFWSKDEDIVVFRFEALKYGAEADIVRAFVREFSGFLCEKFYAPELRPIPSRYARMIDADPSFSIFGARVSITRGSDTIDEILGDVDAVLSRINKRAIVIVDDLDRLDDQIVRNVLFMVRRSLVSSSFSYVLLYDTERLVSSAGDSQVREQIEKFVSAKICLFVDLHDLASFLRDGWRRSLALEHAADSARVLGLQSVLSCLAEALEGGEAKNYVGMIGNIRKIKRLMNAMLLIGIEKVEFNQADFNLLDLSHLMILYLNYPGNFRDIYSNESEGRSGIFSVKRKFDSGARGYENDEEFAGYLENLDPLPRYLIERLFCVNALGISNGDPERSVVNSRACFNSLGRRNLDAYLSLIVRLVVPDPIESSAIYENIIGQISSGVDVDAALNDSAIKDNGYAQCKLWALLASANRKLSSSQKFKAVQLIIDRLPGYSWIGGGGRSDRANAVYSLAIILNDTVSRSNNDLSARDDELDRVRSLILEGEDGQPSIVERLGSADRGLFGVHDLLLFRLLCCGDRHSQLKNISEALIPREMRHADRGMKPELVMRGMRKISQKTFGIFADRYLRPEFSIFNDAQGALSGIDSALSSLTGTELGLVREASLGSIVEFVLYQLANKTMPSGSGVGCGVYDPSGDEDHGGISKLMNSYIFEVCFAPTNSENKLAFARHCLASFSNDFFDEEANSRLIPTVDSLSEGLDLESFRKFWAEHHRSFKESDLAKRSGEVVTVNYRVTYDELLQVWRVLDDAFINEEVLEGLTHEQDRDE